MQGMRVGLCCSRYVPLSKIHPLLVHIVSSFASSSSISGAVALMHSAKDKAYLQRLFYVLFSSRKHAD